MKNMHQNLLLVTTMVLMSTGCSLFGISDVEQLSYKVIIKQEDKEIRMYAAHLIAKTTIIGNFKDAQSEGFKILAGYIFGKNKSQKKIAMTKPVIQQSESEKISMTAPVVISPNENKTWTMAFSMPSQFTMENLPIPNDDRIKIEKVEEKFVAALTFSGFWNESKNAKKGVELTQWLKDHPNYELIKQPMFAGYNPPWTLPFFRRNEMLIELRKK
jgi:hypothetical protein